jgi:hypothetical protein
MEGFAINKKKENKYFNSGFWYKNFVFWHWWGKEMSS